MAKKYLSVKEMVAILRREGHEVDIVDPGNRGLRIVRIDNRRFSHSSSKGNELAREMTGSSLPTGVKRAVARRVKTRRQREARIYGRKLTQKQRAELRKMNAKAKKVGLKPIEGKRARKIRTDRGKDGWKSFIRDYQKRLKLAFQLAPDRVEGLLSWLRNIAIPTDPGVQPAYDYIEKYKDYITRKAVAIIWDLWYLGWYEGHKQRKGVHKRKNVAEYPTADEAGLVPIQMTTAQAVSQTIAVVDYDVGETKKKMEEAGFDPKDFKL